MSLLQWVLSHLDTKVLNLVVDCILILQFSFFQFVFRISAFT